MYLNGKKNIKLIVFDLGNVVLCFDHYIICEQLAQHCHFKPNEVYKRIFLSGLEQKLDEGKISPEEFFEQTKYELKINIKLSLFRKIWNEIFLLNKGIEYPIERLKMNYPLFCLSNTNPWHFEYCISKFPVLANFDRFILSYEVGKRKPDEKIFTYALQKGHIAPKECLYIDDIKAYVEKAEALGIHAIHFQSVKQLCDELVQLCILP